MASSSRARTHAAHAAQEGRRHETIAYQSYDRYFGRVTYTTRQLFRQAPPGIVSERTVHSSTQHMLRRALPRLAGPRALHASLSPPPALHAEPMPRWPTTTAPLRRIPELKGPSDFHMNLGRVVEVLRASYPNFFIERPDSKPRPPDGELPMHGL